MVIVCAEMARDCVVGALGVKKSESSLQEWKVFEPIWREKLREVKERAAAEAKAKETEVGTGEEALSDIDSDEEREYEEFANDWRGLRTRPSTR